MSTGKSLQAKAPQTAGIKIPDADETGKPFDAQMRKDMGRMIEILEEAGGSMELSKLEERMAEAGMRLYLDAVYTEALYAGLVDEDEYCVVSIPSTEPVATPEDLAEHDVYLRAEELGIVRWTGGKRTVVVEDPDTCPLTPAELEIVKRFIIEGDALAESPEVSRMNRLYRERKVTAAELDACMEEVVRRASETPLQEQRGARRPQRRKG